MLWTYLMLTPLGEALPQDLQDRGYLLRETPEGLEVT